jgi:hypothetical protein
MKYVNEKDLQQDLFSRDLGIFNFSIIYTRKEYSVGNCIPDIIIIGFHNDVNQIQLPKKFTTQHIFILWLIKKTKKITLNELASLSYQRMSKINQIVSDLLNYGTISRGENGTLIPNDSFFSFSSEIVAIEAKLSHWRQAIRQAKRYQQFADKVVVAMDENNTPRSTDVLKHFDENRVGLCAVSRTNIEWLVLPRNNPVESFEKEIIISSALSKSNQTLWVRRNFIKASFQA